MKSKTLVQIEREREGTEEGERVGGAVKECGGGVGAGKREHLLALNALVQQKPGERGFPGQLHLVAFNAIPRVPPPPLR
jgi:hypothetical protein